MSATETPNGPHMPFSELKYGDKFIAFPDPERPSILGWGKASHLCVKTGPTAATMLGSGGQVKTELDSQVIRVLL